MQSDVVKHYPVLLNELISIITPQYGGTFIDCTFGQGGYTKKILNYQKPKILVPGQNNAYLEFFVFFKYSSAFFAVDRGSLS